MSNFNNQKHSFHLVDPSPWPFISSFSALFMTFGGVLYMHGYYGGYTFISVWFFLNFIYDVLLVA
jgi:cytochrome c oxidase subunit 3